MTTLVSGASGRYGDWLLNMVGSVKANSDVFDRIVLFDLGLTPRQRRLARGIRGAEVRTVPPFVPHWRQGRTWKTWIWTHVESERLVWLDAGLAVLRPLDAVLAQIDERGYFVVSQGHPLEASVPPDYFERFGLDRGLASRVQVAAGILGFARRSHFYERVIVPTYESAREGLSVGFSPDEVQKLNHGLDEAARPVIRDCRYFRWDQTVLNVHLYRELPDPVVNDLDEFAGWRSAHDHPRQVIWSHRRRGDFRYLTAVTYVPRVAPFGMAFGLVHRARWWHVNHSWLFTPSTYIRKLRHMAGLAR